MAAYKLYVLLENLNVTGKYITNLYTADDTPTHDLTLPSGSTTYTLPGASDVDEKEVYIIKDIIVIGTPAVTNEYIQIWLNDKDTSDVIILGANMGTTVGRQFEKMEYLIGEGTPVKFKQA